MVHPSKHSLSRVQSPARDLIDQVALTVSYIVRITLECLNCILTDCFYIGVEFDTIGRTDEDYLLDQAQSENMCGQAYG